jgi:hypothetical protein
MDHSEFLVILARIVLFALVYIHLFGKIFATTFFLNHDFLFRQLDHIYDRKQWMILDSIIKHH